MKWTFYFGTISSLIITFYANNLSAQHCAGASGSSVCTPSASLTTVGFFPAYDSLPCAIPGVPYDQTLQFHTPASVTSGGTTYPLNWIKIDTLKNLPCGLCWRSSATGDQVNGNSTACIRITGTTYDAPGQFLLYVVVDANVQVGFFPFTVANQNLSSLGLKYYLRVSDLAGNCPLADTASAGRTTTASGSITPVTISGTNAVCTGQSSVFSINAANYYAYKWSTGATTSSITVSSGGAYTVTAYAACTSASASRTLTVNSYPTPTVTAVGPVTFCTGGSVTLNAGAGYSNYAWSTGAASSSINVSQTGNYTCTVTQNGCMGTSNTITVTVNSNPVPTISANGATTFCTGGSVTLDAGVGYSNYNWSNGGTGQMITASQSGNYNCTVTQNGCNGTSNSISVTLNNNPVPIVTPIGPISICSNGSVTLNAGTGYSNYSWSNGATSQTILVNQQGDYDCTVTQNGCSGSSNIVSVTVSNNPVPVVTANGPTTFCSGGSVALDAGTGYSNYNWSNGGTTPIINAAQNGNYNCTVTQNGCTGISNSITVTVISNPVPTVNANGPTTFCTAGSVSLDAGAGYTNYLWSNGLTSQIISASVTGNYSCAVTQNGCTGNSNTVSVTLNDNPSPTVTAGSSTSICSGSSVVLDAGVGYTNYNWSNGATTQMINAALAGSYNCTVTQNGCNGASNTIVVSIINAVATITPNGPTTFCGGGSVTLDAGTGFSDYLWSDGATTPTTTATQTALYTVTTTLSGCTGVSNPLAITVTANNLAPVISATPSLNICPGGTTVLDAGSGFDSYAWSTGATGQSVISLSATTYLVTVTLGICSGSASATVNVGNFPVALNISPAGPVSACAGNMVMLDAGGTYDSYIWNNNDASAMIHVMSSGTYMLTVTQNSCTGVDSVEVTFNPLPVPDISPAGPVNACQGDTVILDAGAGFSLYSWSNSGSVQTTQVSSSGNFGVTVTQNGCTGSDAVNVNFFVRPVVSVSPPGPVVICEGDALSLDAGTGFSSYSWSTGDQSQLIQPLGSGTFVVTVTQNGCAGTDSVEVTINLQPHPSISPVGPITACEGDTITLDAGSGFDSYNWVNIGQTQTLQITYSDRYIINVMQNGCWGSDTLDAVFNTHPLVSISPAGPINACIGDNVSLDAGSGFSSYLWSTGAQTQNIQVNLVGNYSVIAMQNGCDGTDTVAINFSPVPHPVISPSGPVIACVGDNIILDAGGGFSAYAWSNGDLSQATQPAGTGNYYVTVMQNGCTGTDSVIVRFNALPRPAIMPGGSVNACEGDTVTLDAGSAYSSYSWSNGDTLQNTQPLSSGTYRVTVVQNGCDGTDSVELTINPRPVPAISPSGPVIECEGANVILDAGGGYSAYLWSNGEQIQMIQPTISGTYIIAVTENGCSGSDTVDVTFNPNPHATISPSGTQNICSGDSILLDAGSGFNSYLWTNGGSTQIKNVGSTGTYDVTVTQNGCSGTATNPVTVFVNVAPDAKIDTILYNWPTGDLLISNSVSGSSYEWLFGQNDSINISSLGNNDDSLIISCNSYGYYSVIIKNQNGCNDTSAFRFVYVCEGIEDVSTLQKFSVQPNPAKEVINVAYELSGVTIVSIDVVDITGRKIRNVLNEERQLSGEYLRPVRLDGIASGIYFLKFSTESGSLNSKFIKQ